MFAAEQRALVAQEKYELIKEMAQNVAHDLKKPFLLFRYTLAGIKATSSPEEVMRIADENVDAILAQSRQIDEKLQGFLELEREALATTARIKVTETIEALMEDFSTQLKKAGISLSRRHGYRGWIKADRPKLNSVLSNLIQNAIDAQPGGGALHIETRGRGLNALELIVRTPTYIPSDIASRLFERFFTFNKVGGTGIGLAIVKKFVDLHGGQVSCRSTAAEGTSFIIILPTG